MVRRKQSSSGSSVQSDPMIAPLQHRTGHDDVDCFGQVYSVLRAACQSSGPYRASVTPEKIRPMTTHAHTSSSCFSGSTLWDFALMGGQPDRAATVPLLLCR